MSLSDELVQSLLQRLEASERDLEELNNKQVEIKEHNDNLRSLLYEEWSPEVFKPGDPDTPPPCLRDQRQVLELLDNLNRGVGYAHKLVIKYRYPELAAKEPPLPEASNPQPQPVAPVVVQTAQPQQPQQEASRVRSFWTGPFETRIERMRLEYHRERDERMRERPVILTDRVVRDPVEVGNELLAALNETKRFLTDCFLCWPVHRNWAFALNVHEAFRARLTRLLSTIESFTYAATELEAAEIRRQMISQTSYFTRILEAQAQTPASITYITPRDERGRYRP